ncbi:hypothetical protein CR513_62279, partial [Mucuna pruriens]
MAVGIWLTNVMQKNKNSNCNSMSMGAIVGFYPWYPMCLKQPFLSLTLPFYVPCTHPFALSIMFSLNQPRDEFLLLV